MSAERQPRLRSLGEKQQEGLEEYLACCDEGFNGRLVLHFKDGTPQKLQRTDVKRLGRREHLTRER